MTQEETPARKPTREVPRFGEMADDFNARVARIVWCNMATVDRQGRPRTRLVHPIWERTPNGGLVGYLATGRTSHKGRHVSGNPWVSLGYWDAVHEQVQVDAKAEWDDNPGEKARVWELYKSTPPPLGYDPQMIWRGGIEDPDYGVLKLTPWRVELWGIADLMSQAPPRVWRG